MWLFNRKEKFLKCEALQVSNEPCLDKSE